MEYKIGKLLQEQEDEYEHFVRNSDSSQAFASIHYRNALRESLQGVDNYLVAQRENEIVGIMPVFIHKDSKIGCVINALPFFGSHGQAITKSHDPNIEKALIESFNNLAEQNNCVASTIVTSPFSSNLESYERYSKYSFKRSPLSQIARLPSGSWENATLLMDTFHKKTRNMIRKALKEGIQVEFRKDVESMRFLFSTHQENMENIGVPAKPWKFFESLLGNRERGLDFNILIAKKDEKRVAALLLLYFNKTVEYFTPAILNEFRAFQPLSLLIYEGMLDATKRGFAFWNFGGTWANQDGIYRFKSRWGTEDYPYFYYTRIIDQSILSSSVEEIKAEYEYFYVVPFDELNKNKA